MENPFSVTKATEFSDEEIHEYWVDFVGDDKNLMHSFINPNEFLPKYILGGKGCGKTHILRHFSFSLQKIRRQKAKDVLLEDKYIGIYSIFGGINSSRFKGKGIDEDSWQTVFEYYFELYLSILLLQRVCEIFDEIGLESSVELAICSEIKMSFYNHKNVDEKEFRKLSQIYDYLLVLKKEVDFSVNNAAFLKSLNFKVMVSSGDLIFGIPETLVKYLDLFSKVKFIYILDEYEKLFENQKEYINTLVWDKKYPCTFWLGARHYGYTTRKTKTNEQLKQGSEFELIRLDEIIRQDSANYEKFARSMFAKRLRRVLTKNIFDVSLDEIINKSNNYFESNDDNELVQRIKLDHSKSKRKEYPHILRLRSVLIEVFESNNRIKNKGLHSHDEKIDILISQIRVVDNPLHEKYKIMYLYQILYGNNSIDIFKIVDEVNKEFDLYLKKLPSKFNNIDEKFRKDLIAQLLSELKYGTFYHNGLSDMVNISWGNPRAFLTILKNVYERSQFKDEKPFVRTISLESQNFGIREAAEWFYNDAEMYGNESINFYKAINNIAEMLKIYRFADKPTETTPSTFSVKSNGLSYKALQYLNLLSLHSFIIETDNGRIHKNSGLNLRTFQIHRMLCPLWNLPISRRAVVDFSVETCEAILNPDSHQNFQGVYNKIKSSLTAPKFGSYKPGRLFE